MERAREGKRGGGAGKKVCMYHTHTHTTTLHTHTHTHTHKRERDRQTDRERERDLAMKAALRRHDTAVARRLLGHGCHGGKQRGF